VMEQLGDIHCPVLVIAADQDYTPLAYKEAYVARLPQARLEIIHDSRHGTPMDQPKQFNRTVLTFLQENTPLAQE